MAAFGDLPGPSTTVKDTFGPHVDENILGTLSSAERTASLHLVQMFPDADPNHIIQSIAQAQLSTDELIDDLTQNNYPRLRTRVEKERIVKQCQDYLNPEKFDVNEYLTIFPNPRATFYGHDENVRPVTELYKQHARVYLCNKFPHMHQAFLYRLLIHFNNQLLPTVDQIEAPNGKRQKMNARVKIKVPFSNTPNLRQYLKRARHDQQPYPEQVDAQFYRELQYITFRQQINDAIDERTTARELRLVEAQENGQLLECACCYEDNVLPEEMVFCSGPNDTHGYCRTCVVTHAETQVEEGRHRVKCIDTKCASEFAINELQTLLRPNFLNRILRRIQQDELRRAQLPNMAECPFCDFAMIIENDQEKVFKCHNPECLKETCRECRELSHIPLRCDEVEGDAETRMRVFVENEMANALIRICPSCNTRTVKTEGCNKMTCSCGQAFCYICRQKVDGYEHFDVKQTGKNRKPMCQLSTSIDAVNAKAAKEAGERAKQLFMSKNETAKKVSIKRAAEGKDLDVDALVNDVKRKKTKPKQAPMTKEEFFMRLVDTERVPPVQIVNPNVTVPPPRVQDYPHEPPTQLAFPIHQPQNLRHARPFWEQTLQVRPSPPLSAYMLGNPFVPLRPQLTLPVQTLPQQPFMFPGQNDHRGYFEPPPAGPNWPPLFPVPPPNVANFGQKHIELLDAQRRNQRRLNKELKKNLRNVLGLSLEEAALVTAGLELDSDQSDEDNQAQLIEDEDEDDGNRFAGSGDDDSDHPDPDARFSSGSDLAGDDDGAAEVGEALSPDFDTDPDERPRADFEDSDDERERRGIHIHGHEQRAQRGPNRYLRTPLTHTHPGPVVPQAEPVAFPAPLAAELHHMQDQNQAGQDAQPNHIDQPAASGEPIQARKVEGRNAISLDLDIHKPSATNGNQLLNQAPIPVRPAHPQFVNTWKGRQKGVPAPQAIQPTMNTWKGREKGVPAPQAAPSTASTTMMDAHQAPVADPNQVQTQATKWDDYNLRKCVKFFETLINFSKERNAEAGVIELIRETVPLLRVALNNGQATIAGLDPVPATPLNEPIPTMTRNVQKQQIVRRYSKDKHYPSATPREPINEPQDAEANSNDPDHLAAQIDTSIHSDQLASSANQSNRHGNEKSINFCSSSRFPAEITGQELKDALKMIDDSYERLQVQLQQAMDYDEQEKILDRLSKLMAQRLEVVDQLEMRGVNIQPLPESSSQSSSAIVRQSVVPASPQATPFSTEHLSCIDHTQFGVLTLQQLYDIHRTLRGHVNDYRKQIQTSAKMGGSSSNELGDALRKALYQTAVCEQHIKHLDNAFMPVVRKDSEAQKTEEMPLSIKDHLLSVARSLQQTISGTSEQIRKTQKALVVSDLPFSSVTKLLEIRDALLKQQNAIEEQLLKGGMTEMQLNCVLRPYNYLGDDDGEMAPGASGLNTENNGDQQLNGQQLGIAITTVKQTEFERHLLNVLEQQMVILNEAELTRRHASATATMNLERQIANIRLSLCESVEHLNKAKTADQTAKLDHDKRLRDLQTEINWRRNSINQQHARALTVAHSSSALEVEHVGHKRPSLDHLMDECKALNITVMVGQQVDRMIRRHRKRQTGASKDEEEVVLSLDTDDETVTVTGQPSAKVAKIDTHKELSPEKSTRPKSSSQDSEPDFSDRHAKDGESSNELPVLQSLDNALLDEVIG